MGLWSWLTGGASRAPATPGSDLTNAVVHDLPLSSQFSRIGGSLTPVAVSHILRAADGGSPRQLVDLAHECRQKDCHLQGTLAARELDVTSLDWVVAPPTDPTPAEQEAADAFATAWENATTNTALGHLVGESTLFGYAYAEQFWGVASGELAGKLVPERLKPISCGRFGFRQSDGKLLFDERHTGSVDGANGVDLLEKYGPAKFVELRRRINGDVASREGLARCLVWAALGRNWSLKDWLQLAEIGWKPWRVGYYKPGSDKQSIGILKRLMERLSATGSAALPDDLRVDISWPKGTVSSSSGPHKEISDHLASEMSKAIIHGTLTMDAGTKGARSLGEVHGDGRRSVRDDDARDVAASITRHSAVPFTQFNYGTSVRPCRLLFVTEDQLDLEKFANELKTLREAGLRRIPAAWVRDRAGIPEAAEDEETLDELDIPIEVDTSAIGDAEAADQADGA